MPKMKDDTHTDEETVRRRDEALRRALNTPPQPRGKREQGAAPHKEKRRPSRLSEQKRGKQDQSPKK